MNETVIVESSQMAHTYDTIVYLRNHPECIHSQIHAQIFDPFQKRNVFEGYISCGQFIDNFDPHCFEMLRDLHEFHHTCGHVIHHYYLSKECE